MRILLVLAVTLALAWPTSSPASGQDTDSPWWLRPHRLLQTNLREIDATMDLDRYVADVKQFGADVVLFNVGGIVANYPTELPYHYRNPLMKGDLVGTVLERLHAEGIRMIGRFDFSKINERIAAQHPEWLYVGEDGKTVNYNGQVHTCPSGGYQQECMLKILGEAIDRYPLDGVFFNMIGYRRRDYSGNYHGICQCDACRRRFKQYSGLELPRAADDSPAYRKYVEFTDMMRDQQFQRVSAFLKAKRPDLCICTYATAGVDVIRKESNSPLGRGTYYDTDKAQWTLATCGRRQLANAAVYFIAIPYRHAAVAPALTVRRLWQQMVNGAWLDFYCIGPLARQEDRTGLEAAAAVFRFHRDNEHWLVDTQSAARVGLVRRGDQEYQGLLQILSENHVPFRLVDLHQELPPQLELLVVPAARGLPAGQAELLDRFVRRGGKLLLTGGAPDGLDCLGPARLLQTRPSEKGAYIRIRPEDKQRLKVPLLEQLDLVFLQGEFHVYQCDGGVQGLLRLIPADMFGPPEKCYYRHVSKHPGLLYRPAGKGAVAAFAFRIGEHYARQAHQGHAALVMGALEHVLGYRRRLRVAAPPLVEVSHRAGRQGRFQWVSLLNHTGARGNALHPPVPIRDIELRLVPQRPVHEVRLLQARQKLPFTVQSDGTVVVRLEQLDQYEVVVFQ